MQDDRREQLVALWMESFGDDRCAVQNFFDTAFSPDRYHAIEMDGQIVSALYWLDYKVESSKVAYIYAAATQKEYRDRGIFRRLMEESHHILLDKGYSGAALVPGSKELFDLYEKFGYEVTIFRPENLGKINNESGQSIRISAEEYELIRNRMLPRLAAIPEDYVMKYAETFAYFYKNDNEIYAVSKDNQARIFELIREDDFICNKPHGMFLPLKESCPVPCYIGLDLG